MGENIGSVSKELALPGGMSHLPPADLIDPVIEEYKKGLDLSLIAENLKRTPHERVIRMGETIDWINRWHKEMKKRRQDMIEFEKVVRLFNSSRIEYIVIGGWAAILHGSVRTTVDSDFVYRRSNANIEKLVGAFQPYSPYLRGAPPNLPFKFDISTVRNGLNFTLTTGGLGDVDLLGEVAGGGNYEALLPFTEEMEIMGLPVRCVNLETLIQLKRAAGRAKDFEALAELQTILAGRKER